MESREQNGLMLTAIDMETVQGLITAVNESKLDEQSKWALRRKLDIMQDAILNGPQSILAVIS